MESVDFNFLDQGKFGGPEISQTYLGMALKIPRDSCNPVGCVTLLFISNPVTAMFVDFKN